MKLFLAIFVAGVLLAGGIYLFQTPPYQWSSVYKPGDVEEKSYAEKVMEQQKKDYPLEKMNSTKP